MDSSLVLCFSDVCEVVNLMKLVQCSIENMSSTAALVTFAGLVRK